MAVEPDVMASAVKTPRSSAQTELLQAPEVVLDPPAFDDATVGNQGEFSRSYPALDLFLASDGVTNFWKWLGMN
jgi:hypothetical protein